VAETTRSWDCGRKIPEGEGLEVDDGLGVGVGVGAAEPSISMFET
jgi:hypothetical protein